jgi:hypothetical protein
MDADEYSNLSIEARISLEQHRLDQQIQANAVRFLLEGGETEAAMALLSCSLTASYQMPDQFSYDYSSSIDILVKCNLERKTVKHIK